MTLEVLLAAVKQDQTLLKKINLQSDAIICNQDIDGLFEYKKIKYDSHCVSWFNFSEKGVGLNRNNALMRSQADICLIADDDIVYNSDYVEVVLRAFEENPKADVILFNVRSTSDYHPYKCRKKIKINRLNCGRFGGVRIAFRRLQVIKNAVFFNLLFGGGARFGSGEDVMFVESCLKVGLRVIAVPYEILGFREERQSTWFHGYDDKFFADMGASYANHYGRLAYGVAVVQMIRHKKEFLQNIGFRKALALVKSGIETYKSI